MRTAGYVTEANLERHAEAWLEEIRNSIPERPQLQLNPARCALLVIDMNRYFAHPKGRCFLPATAAIVPRVMAVLDAWRGRGGTVVFTRHGHEGPDDLGVMGKFWDDYIRAEEPDAEIINELEPRADEPVLRKTTYDAFVGTELEPLLRERKIDQVLVTGVLTHMCCETTARSAFCRGFEVYVAADGTATSGEGLHLSSLKAMADSVAVVLSTREVLERCATAS
jgi:nicotinamidase-related amidase